MNAIEALNIIEERIQHIPASLPVHVQIKKIINSVRTKVGETSDDAPGRRMEDMLTSGSTKGPAA